MRFQITLVALAAVVAFGCNSAAPAEPDPAALPDQPKFEGSVVPELVGSWKSTDGASDMGLGKDGEMTFNTDVNTPGGRQTVKVSGKWLAKDKTLLLQNTSGKQVKVIAYTYQVVDPTTLELSLSFPKTKTIYKKK